MGLAFVAFGVRLEVVLWCIGKEGGGRVRMRSLRVMYLSKSSGYYPSM